MNGTETRMHESEAKLHNADAIAVMKVTDVENDLKEAVKKRQMIAEMLHTCEYAKSELTDVNKVMKDDIYVQNEEVAEMEMKIGNFIRILKEERDRSKKLIEGNGGVENHMRECM